MCKFTHKYLKEEYKVMKFNLAWLFLLLTLVASTHSHKSTGSITINVNNPAQPELLHFWRSTGMCPPEPHHESAAWFLSTDMLHNLALISAVPHQGIQQVRIHWLLDTVTVVGYKNGNPVYNYTNLDAIVSRLWKLGLKPGFELMGNPSGIYTNFENSTQIYWWRDLVSNIAKRYIRQFGLDYVKEWNFETWNEPRLNGDFDELNMTQKGFLNYYDACSEGLDDAARELILGGPGGECYQYDLEKSFCWALIEHTQNGRNYFTGETGIRLDYFSIHKKGAEPHNTNVLLMLEIETILELQRHYPALESIPVYNDEGDPLVGWSKPKWWRADATYAAMAAKILVIHQHKIHSLVPPSFNLQLFSNDNAFMSYNPHFFTQRTLLARFQMNNTSPAHVQFIRKPIHSVMGLMAKLGDHYLQSSHFLVCINTTVPGGNSSERLGYLISTSSLSDRPHDSLNRTFNASQTPFYTSIIIYNSMDSVNISGYDYIQINFTGLLRYNVFGKQNTNNPSAWLLIYQIDNNGTNPYKIWQNFGSPKTPNLHQLQCMRDSEEPMRIYGPETIDTSVGTFSGWIPLPGIWLVQLCSHPDEMLGEVTGIQIFNITRNQVLIIWDDRNIHTKCIKSFVVEFAADDPSNFRRINPNNIIFNSFVFAPRVKSSKEYTNGKETKQNSIYTIQRSDKALMATRQSAESTSGYYRIYALDILDQPGKMSRITKYGDRLL